jgi:hypothetical protein
VKNSRQQALLGVALAGACALALVPGSGAGARPHTPPGKRIWHGVSDTGSAADYRAFNRQVRAHTPLLQAFYHWGVPLTTGALDRWEVTDTRGVLSLSTAPGGGPELITPREIANGRDDHYLLRLNQSIDNSGQVVYIRPFAEMNLHLNPYSAFNADGSPRKGHSTHAFKNAWRRFALIVRGGKRRRINAKLVRLGMPRIARAGSNRVQRAAYYRGLEVPHELDRPRVAFMWMPLTRGSPDVPGNTPRSYFPGRNYVDWVGTDAYAKFANRTLWKNLIAFYRDFRGYPFAIGEYGPWDNDFQGVFTRHMHRWGRKHGRVHALLFFRSVDTENAFNLQYYPGAKRELREILDRPRYPEYAPGTHDVDKPDGDSGGITP